MANVYLNLLDVAKFNADDKVVDLIEENLTFAPEARLLPAKTIKGTSYNTLIRTAYPQPTFRAINEGTETKKSTYQNKRVEAFFLDGQLEMDEAAVMADDAGEQHSLSLEASGMMMGSLTKLGTQLWYGISGGGDALGFPGAVEIVHSDLVSDGGGTTATTGSSIYGLKLGSQYVQFVFGLGQVFSLGEWRKQTMIRSSKSLTCWLNSLSGYVGVHITADSGKTATDAMIGTWLSKYPVGLKPDVLFMSRRTAMQLQTARSATSITNSSPKANNGGDVWAPEPVSSNGIPIVVTDSLLDTETLT